jgi:hypothetical protein
VEKEMGRYKRIKNASDNLSEQPLEWLQAQLKHWQFMADTCALVGPRRHEVEYRRKAKRVERAIKEKVGKTGVAPDGKENPPR